MAHIFVTAHNKRISGFQRKAARFLSYFFFFFFFFLAFNLLSYDLQQEVKVF